jgi:hypothetical protein
MTRRTEGRTVYEIIPPWAWVSTHRSGSLPPRSIRSYAVGLWGVDGLGLWGP